MNEIAWAAGFIDGEGSIGVYRKGKWWSLSLSASNTDIRPLQKLQKLFKGTFHKKKEPRDNRKQKFEWIVQGKTAAQALIQMREFLTCKQEQADLGIEFAQYLRVGPERDIKTGRYLLTKNENIEQEKLRISKQLKDCKKNPTTHLSFRPVLP
jgi:hypothetical protein